MAMPFKNVFKIFILKQHRGFKYLKSFRNLIFNLVTYKSIMQCKSIKPNTQSNSINKTKEITRRKILCHEMYFNENFMPLCYIKYNNTSTEIKIMKITQQFSHVQNINMLHLQSDALFSKNSRVFGSMLIIISEAKFQGQKLSMQSL